MTALPESRPRSVAIDLAANAWTRRLVAQLSAGAFVPWAEWLDDAYELLPSRRTHHQDLDAVAKWRLMRDQVLRSLDVLELEATVTRTDALLPAPVAHHYADQAGLVHVHPKAGDLAFAPDVPARVLLADDAQSVHERAMLARFGLVPAGGRVPMRLRGFCGQVDDQAEDRLGNAEQWRDHLRAWVTLYGEPILSVEPYTYAEEPAALVTQIREAIELNGLPLAVDGPHAGVWAATTVLAFVRHDRAGAVLPAELAPLGPPLTVIEHGRRRVNAEVAGRNLPGPRGAL